MRVLLNYCGFLKPATIITERKLFSKCRNTLFIADMCHLENCYFRNNLSQILYNNCQWTDIRTRINIRYLEIQKEILNYEQYKAHIRNYLEYCKSQKCLDAKTLKAYQIDLRQFSEQISNINITEITSEILEQYVSQLHEQYKPKTCKTQNSIGKSPVPLLGLQGNH